MCWNLKGYAKNFPTIRIGFLQVVLRTTDLKSDLKRIKKVDFKTFTHMFVDFINCL